MPENLKLLLSNEINVNNNNCIVFNQSWYEK